MISPECNFNKFSDKVKNLNWEQIIAQASRERKAAIDLRDKDKYREQKSAEYGQELGWLLQILRYPSKYCDKPLAEPSRTLFAPIINALVEKGELPLSAAVLIKKDDAK